MQGCLSREFAPPPQHQNTCVRAHITLYPIGLECGIEIVIVKLLNSRAMNQMVRTFKFYMGKVIFRSFDSQIFHYC